MKKLIICITLLANIIYAWADSGMARWITTPETGADQYNTWTVFRRDLNISRMPKEAIATIAADTKYWLWVNGQLAVFEGGLKRGPNPNDTYQDRIDLRPYLRKGENRIAILLWHFGRSGFSHTDSGHSGLLFELSDGRHTMLASDSTWLCKLHPAYGTTGNPRPNWRLSEANIRFDARQDLDQWQTAEPKGFFKAAEAGRAGDAPWNKLVLRPIPQWKDFGVKPVAFTIDQNGRDNVVTASLPYNMQLTPVITLVDEHGGQTVKISTDHSYAGSQHNIRAEYVTRKGRQTYESLGWMNGEKIIVTVPKGVKIEKLAYRETGYDAEPEGTFACSDPFYNRFWQKATRTLYVNMRDNYFDCPDRERAQWWGDMVLLMAESFYTYSTQAHQLMKKALYELAGWQRADGVLYGPVPGSYEDELPAQMLATVGRYGVWNYYMNTGDRQTLEHMYPAVKRYLQLWQTDSTGLTVLRKGGWFWGDWGTNKDMHLIIAAWHYIALDGAALMADELGKTGEAAEYRSVMARLKTAFNSLWNGYAYRHPTYHDVTDDRVQALAVIAGIAGEDKYDRIADLLKTKENASPYMEKYVMEALFRMHRGTQGMERTRKRFAEMVNDTQHTTLYEGWGIGRKGFGGGTTNHAWSGGAQIVIASQLCGISPLEPGYRTFLVEPQPASIDSVAISFPTVRGTIAFDMKSKAGTTISLTVPQGTTAIVRLEEGKTVTVNGRKPSATQTDVEEKWQRKGYHALSLKPGKYTLTHQ